MSRGAGPLTVTATATAAAAVAAAVAVLAVEALAVVAVVAAAVAAQTDWSTGFGLSRTSVLENSTWLHVGLTVPGMGDDDGALVLQVVGARTLQKTPPCEPRYPRILSRAPSAV